MANPKPQWAYIMGPVAAAAAVTVPFSASNASSEDTQFRVSSMSQAAAPSRPPFAATSATAYVDERLLDAKLATVEARTETKFAQLIGKLDLIASDVGKLSTATSEMKASIAELDKKTGNTRTIVITTVIGATLSMAALAYAAVQIFQSGMGISATAYSAGLAASAPSQPSMNKAD